MRPDPLLTARRIAAAAPVAARDPEGEAVAVTAAVGEARRRRALILTIFIIAMAQAMMVGLMAMTPLHLMHHAGTAELVGLTLSLHIAGMYALSPVFGALASRFGRLPVIAIGWVTLLVAIVCAYFAGPSHLLVQVAMILLGFGWGAVTVAGAALLTELTTLADRPRWQGRSDTCMSAAGAIAGALSGLVFAFGDYSFLALVTGGLLALGAVASIQLAVFTRR